MKAGRPRVLLAEDHAGVTKALIEVLEPHCDVVGLATDGGEAIDKALQLHPVIAIVDVGLPTVNGLDICRRITTRNPGAKVILMSGMLDANPRVPAKQQPAEFASAGCCCLKICGC